MFEYAATVVKIVDGDTVDVLVDLGFDTFVGGKRGRIRLYGIDAPESRTRDKEEKKYGLLAKRFVEDFMPVGTVVTLRTYKDKGGKYGRYMGDFKRYDKWLCEELVKNHLAVEYFGQSKALIQEAHLRNRALCDESSVPSVAEYEDRL